MHSPPRPSAWRLTDCLSSLVRSSWASLTEPTSLASFHGKFIEVAHLCCKSGRVVMYFSRKSFVIVDAFKMCSLDIFGFA